MEQTPEQASPTGTVAPRRRAATSASYSITMRLHTELDPGLIGAVATVIAQAGGIVTAIDVAESRHDRLVVDVTCSATDSVHAGEIVDEVDGLGGITVHKVSDRTFLLHLGGKIEVASKVPLRTRDDLCQSGPRCPDQRSAVGAEAAGRRAHPGAGAGAMAEGNVVSALANPNPKVDPAEAGRHAAVVASGRSDYPNQVNNVLAFPGVLRGLPDARARRSVRCRCRRASRCRGRGPQDDMTRRLRGVD